MVVVSSVTCVGVGGNLVAIQASRISTYLHFWSIPGVLPYKMRQHWPNPCTTFFSSGNITMQTRPYHIATVFKLVIFVHRLMETMVLVIILAFSNPMMVRLNFIVSPRGELQISTGAAHAGYSWTLSLPLCHLSAPGRGGTHLRSFHYLLPICCFAAGK